MEKFDIKKIKVIIGLGNPGTKYLKNRHNIGFRVVDEIANKFLASWKKSDVMESTQINIDSQSICLIKPLTFMNTSGKVIPTFKKKGVKAEEILIIHDELEKNFGNLSIKFGGSARGHNGLRSIIGLIGKEFWRFRFGIGRPEEKSEVGNFVLSNFYEQQEKDIDELILKSIDIILCS
ncbi:aminoacyl-tRNA hydrolase [Candidatus Dependentiae bacterium]